MPGLRLTQMTSGCRFALTHFPYISVWTESEFLGQKLYSESQAFIALCSSGAEIELMFVNTWFTNALNT